MKKEKYGPYRPIINKSKDRISSLKNNTPAVFEIHERRFPVNLGKRKAFELLKQGIKDAVIEKRTSSEAGKSAVHKHDKKILQYSQKHNIDPDLTRAVIYAENARGYYGKPFDMLDISKTVLPMNIHREIWADLLEGKPKDIYNEDINIETGTVLLKRIVDRVKKPTPEKIGTIWNSASQDYISEFGNFVGEVYRKRPWNYSD